MTSKVLIVTTDSSSQLADLKDAGSIALSYDGSKIYTVNRTELAGISTANWKVIGRWPLKSPPVNTSPVLVRTGITADGKGTFAVPSSRGLVIYREPEMIGDYVTDKITSDVGGEDRQWLALSHFASVDLWRMEDLLYTCKVQQGSQ